MPENTIPAFRRALALGVAGIETDIHATRDDHLLVIHDPSLQRTHGHPGDIRTMTLAAVHQVAPDIPTLADLLILVGDRVHLDLEVKQPGLEAMILNHLAGYPNVRWAISSFDWQSLGRFRVLDPTIEIWVLGMRAEPVLWETAAALGGSLIALHERALSAPIVAIAHANGLRVMAWTVNDPKRARELETMGVDILCTDHPERMDPGYGHIHQP